MKKGKLDLSNILNTFSKLNLFFSKLKSTYLFPFFPLAARNEQPVQIGQLRGHTAIVNSNEIVTTFLKNLIATP